MSQHAIFRSKALQNYLQSKEKIILPCFIAPPVFALYWLLFGIFLLSGYIAWVEQIPLYATGPGLIPAQSTATSQTLAIVFLPASTELRPQLGLPVIIQIGSVGPRLNGVVSTIEPETLSPQDVQKQYALKISEPATAVIVSLQTRLSSSTYAGSLILAQVQVGSQRLLAQFPVLNTLYERYLQ